MSAIPRCRSLFGSHKFEARFSYADAPDIQSVKHGPFQSTSVAALETYMRAYQPKTYHGDICVRCGTVVKREGA